MPYGSAICQLVHRILLTGLMIPVFWISLCSQTFTYLPVLDVSVEVDGDSLAFPFTGGLAMPQFNSIDLEGDGQQDLLIFDRIGAHILPFVLRDGQFAYAPQYAAQFPPLANFAHFADFDADGLADIFSSGQQTASVAELRVYRQQREAGQMYFEAFPYQLNDSAGALVEMHAFDLPALQDINGDGDLDLLHFPRTGQHIFYYENQSLESGYGTDSLHFQLYDDCWGKLEYTLNGLELDVCPGRPAGSSAGRAYCAGSTLLAFDYDDDGDQDLLYSGLTDDSLSLLQNSGIAADAHITSIDKSYLLDEFEQFVDFPAPFWLDLNADGLLDLAISSNRVAAVLDGSTADRFYLFENVASNKQPVFELRSQSFLVDQTIDHGFRSSPASFDYNGDGLADLLLAANVNDPFFSFRSELWLYENTGSSSEPAFQLVAEDYLELSQYQMKAAHPAIGDLDGDGDDDLLLGDKNGQLVYFENMAGAGQAVDFQYRSNFFDSIDVGTYSRPQIIDMNGDAWNDLVIGSWNGNLSFYKNMGGIFGLQTNQLGGIYPDTFGIESSPLVLQLPGESALQLLLATRSGRIERYSGLEELSGNWILEEEQFAGIRVGSSVSLSAADLDGEGHLELLLGNERGGLNVFQAQEQTSSVQFVENNQHDFPVQIYPNPARDHLKIALNAINIPLVELTLINYLGQKVLHTQIIPSKLFQHIPVVDLPRGFYLCKINVVGQQITLPIILH